jgi:hypothetical protein
MRRRAGQLPGAGRGGVVVRMLALLLAATCEAGEAGSLQLGRSLLSQCDPSAFTNSYVSACTQQGGGGSSITSLVRDAGEACAPERLDTVSALACGQALRHQHELGHASVCPCPCTAVCIASPKSAVGRMQRTHV